MVALNHYCFSTKTKQRQWEGQRLSDSFFLSNPHSPSGLVVLSEKGCLVNLDISSLQNEEMVPLANGTRMILRVCELKNVERIVS